MKRRDAFSNCHPAVSLLYFCLVLLFSMCLMHPACLAVSFVCAGGYLLFVNGWRGGRVLLYALPLLVFTLVVNPAFNHRGATILAYFPSGNPLTLESILYGAAASVMLVTVLLWFSCYTHVMTSDKFVYLFGRVIPALSLLLSMALRFVPKFIAQMKAVAEAQRCMGRSLSRGSLWQRCRTGAAIVSITITWSLENAIETADSMKARGYGLPGRSAYSIYRMTRRDWALVAWLLCCGGYLLSGWVVGSFRWHYFPVMTRWTAEGSFIGLMAVYLLLGLTPLLVNGLESRALARAGI